MLWTVLLILLLMWALGLGFGVAGNLIHILLVVALVVVNELVFAALIARVTPGPRTGRRRVRMPRAQFLDRKVGL